MLVMSTSSFLLWRWRLTLLPEAMDMLSSRRDCDSLKRLLLDEDTTDDMTNVEKVTKRCQQGTNRRAHKLALLHRA